MSKVIIFGNCRSAEVAHFYLTHDSEHEVVGFTVDSSYIEQESFHDLPIVPFETLEKHYAPSSHQLFIPTGPQKVNKLRAEKYRSAKERGYCFISYISSQAICHGTSIGENCFILAGNVIQPFASIGNNCILSSGNHIGHHTIINDHCFLASNVVIGGGTNVGAYTFMGMNSTLRHDLKIGKENIIGAGSVILSDTKDQAVYSPGAAQLLEVPSNLVLI
jgi:sugar O-acyltransferase (sialic acid O-acetyltransferase NeuD family)